MRTWLLDCWAGMKAAAIAANSLPVFLVGTTLPEQAIKIIIIREWTNERRRIERRVIPDTLGVDVLGELDIVTGEVILALVIASVLVN